MSNPTIDLQERIRVAIERATPLRIVGARSKDFYGGPLIGETLETGSLQGIVDYDPAELVLTARAGTPLADIEATLAQRGQMLAFEPPRFGGRGTLGGAVAAGLSGPRRAYAGAVRDFVLGIRMIDGQARLLRFGGQVIKNVAGFDVARLLAGSLGILGVITEVSLKTLPRPARELTVRYELDAATAIRRCNEWAGQPIPLSATCHLDDCLYVRLSGAEAAVQAAHARLGGELVDRDTVFWTALRDHTQPFFTNASTLWRISVPATTDRLAFDGPQLVEWGGALRWTSAAIPQHVRERIVAIGGHITRFRGPPQDAATFQQLTPTLQSLHRRLKQVFDPHGVFNRARLHEL